MKKIKQLSFIGLALTFILSSCSMEKRQYMPGYYLSWKNVNHSNDILVKNNTNNAEKAENKNKVEPIVTTEKTETSSFENSQINENTITASTDNSIFIPASTKFDLNKNKNKTVVSENIPTSVTKTIVKTDSKQNKKANKKSATDGGGKSQLVALLLAIFIGVLGIHRFYLGYTGIGILMLLTGGVCGVLAIIDIIRIITGDLKPNGGDYEKKFL